MTRGLSAEQLEGVWAAVPTPWTSDFGIDGAVLRENLQRYREWGVAGVYTSDADGEFYGLELSEFRTLMEAFAQALQGTDLAAAAGVTWSHTRGTVERIQIALEHGISKVHVGLPYWMPLPEDDVERFLDDLASAAPGARWVHYRTPRALFLPDGRRYRQLAASHPGQLIGTKLVTTDFVEAQEIICHSPMLSHFVGDTFLVPGRLAGATGVYSYWVNTLPRWTLRTWELCQQGTWEQAAARQAKLISWEANCLKKLREQGYRHAVLAKARIKVTNLLLDSGFTCPPYHELAPPLQEQLKRDFDKHWGAEREEECSLRVD